MRQLCLGFTQKNAPIRRGVFDESKNYRLK